MPGRKPTRILAVLMNITDGQLCASVYPMAWVQVFGDNAPKPSGWVNYYPVGLRRYQLYIVSPWPSVKFDKDTAIKYATDYVTGNLKIVRTDLKTLAKITGYLDIDTESFIGANP